MPGRLRRTRTAILVAVITAAGCTNAAPPRRMSAIYDPPTGKLMVLCADQDGDGRIDQWTYLDGNRPLRGEGDADGDGRIDRWEYFDANAKLTAVGTSSRNDGVEDTWSSTTGTETRIDKSRLRDRHVDRREFLNGSTLVRVEEDTNADGLMDKWERYEGAVLREAAFDTTRSRGRANRRLVYDAQGHYAGVEADLKGDGSFVRLSGDAADAAKAGVQR